MKKLKDSKIGKLLKDKAPKVFEIAGNLLPEKGVLGIVKNLIDKEPDLTAEEKAQLHKEVVELQNCKVKNQIFNGVGMRMAILTKLFSQA